MGEIKFRAWDKSKGKFITWQEDSEHVVILQNGEIRIQNGTGTSVSPSFFHREIIIQQFIGLLDKNGKKIYEGDILNICGYSDKNDVGVVKFSECCFMVRHLGNDKCNGKYITEEISIQYFVDKNINIKVIGNIHENPELLKED